MAFSLLPVFTIDIAYLIAYIWGYTHIYTYTHIFVYIHAYTCVDIYAYIWASLVAQLVKNLPAMREIWV